MATRNCSDRLPHDLLADLRRRGLRLSEDRGRLKVAPKSSLTPDLRKTLVSRKDALLSALSAQNQLLRMPLSKFGRKGCPIEIKVPDLPETLWFVPGIPHVDPLVQKGIDRGRIWTAAELTDLLQIPGLNAEGIATIARAKAEFGGDLISVEPLMSQYPNDDARAVRAKDDCPACGGMRFWRSVNGALACGTCHPPATPNLVAEWIDGPGPDGEGTNV